MRNILNEEQKRATQGNVSKLLDLKGSKNLLFHCFNYIKPEKGFLWLYVVMSVVILVISVRISISKETVLFFKEILTYINTAYLAIFAVLVTAFSLAQAVVGKNVIAMLLATEVPTKAVAKKKDTVATEKEDIKESVLFQYNFHTLGLIFYYILMILLNISLLLFFISIPDFFYIEIFPNIVNIVLAFIGCWFYLSLIFHGIIELIPFIFNIYSTISYKNFINTVIFLKEEPSSATYDSEDE